MVSNSNNIQISGMGDMSVVFWGYAHYSWDRHLWDSRPEYLIRKSSSCAIQIRSGFRHNCLLVKLAGAKSAFAAKLFWTTTSTSVRLSLLVLYYRLLNHMDM